MNTQLLEQIGLTKTEIKLYLALLKLGESSTSNIMKESQVPASKVYEFLDKLIKKGLVSYIVSNNKRRFRAENPENLKNFLRDKKEKLDKQISQTDLIIPQLNRLNTEKEEEETEVSVCKGLAGLKSLYEKNLKILEKGDTHYILGAPKVGNEKIEGYLLDWHKRRIKKGIKCRYIYDDDAKQYAEVREKMPLTEIKYLSKEIVSPVWIEIFKGYVATGHITNSGTTIFLIKDNEVAKKYLSYFEIIWKNSKKA
ncbi:MAG: helix-turn-helix domain-containing protein [archaeon]